MARGAFGTAILLVAAIGFAALASGAGEGQLGPPSPPAPPEGIEVRLPPDLTFGAAGPLPAVVFRHTTHTAFAGGQCVACHPQPFKILHPARRTSHAEMNAGRSCGICHDGRRGFGTAAADACQRCHTGAATAAKVPPAPPPARKAPPAKAAAAPAAPPAAGPGDVTIRKGASSPGSVTFRHAAHGGAGARCDRCHPEPFAMKAGATMLEKAAMMQGKTCGTCHDGRQAFGVADAAHCARCHAPGGASR